MNRKNAPSIVRTWTVLGTYQGIDTADLDDHQDPIDLVARSTSPDAGTARFHLVLWAVPGSATLVLGVWILVTVRVGHYCF
jgi:hypothetical protein